MVSLHFLSLRLYPSSLPLLLRPCAVLQSRETLLTRREKYHIRLLMTTKQIRIYYNPSPILGLTVVPSSCLDLSVSYLTRLSYVALHISTSNIRKLTLIRFVSLDPTTLAISLKRRNRGMVRSHTATFANISNMLVNNQISIFVPYIPSQQLNRCIFHMNQ